MNWNFEEGGRFTGKAVKEEQVHTPFTESALEIYDYLIHLTLNKSLVWFMNSPPWHSTGLKNSLENIET